MISWPKKTLEVTVVHVWYEYPYNILDQHRLWHFDPKVDKRSLEVKIRSNLKNTPRDPIFCKHTHMISPIIIDYDILTPEVMRYHWRSQEVKKRSNLKNAYRIATSSLCTHIISQTNIGYGVLTSKVIKGHQWSLEVKKRSNLKKVTRDPVLFLY